MRGDPGLHDVPAALNRMGLGDFEERDGEGWRRCPGHFGRTGHEDSSPSWSINLVSGLHHCFSCGYGGNLEHLVSGMLRLNHTESSAWLADPALLASAIETRLRTIQRSAAAHAVINLAGFTLPPIDRLDRRRISLEAAIRFEILWDGRNFILPIRDGAHNLIGYQIKRDGYVRNRPRGVAKSRCLFGLGAFHGATAVLVESPLDTARLWTAGIDGGVASYGAVVSDEQIELLVGAAKHLIIALDDDNAGQLGADQVETDLNYRIGPVRRFAYPRPCGKDPGELDDDQLRHGIEHARTRLEHLNERLLR